MNELQKYFIEKMKQKKLPLKSIVAIMGNIQCESAWNITAIEKGSGIGFGLCQWSFGRRKELEKYGTDIDSQIDFLYKELKGNQYINKKGYLTKNDFLNGNGTIEELTRGFCFCWERPKYETSHIDKRIEYAQKFYKEVATEEVENTYYPKYKGTSMSIVTALKSIEVDGSYCHRAIIAEANHILNYRGSYTQNLEMLTLLRRGILIKERNNVAI